MTNSAKVATFTSLERGNGESFAAYKERRTQSQKAGRAERKAVQGGTHTSRHMRRHPAPIVVKGEVIKPAPMRGTYGLDLMAAFARKRLNAILAKAKAKSQPIPLAA